MSIVLQKSKSFSRPKKPSLRKADYLFKKVLYKDEKIVVYEVFEKEKLVLSDKNEEWSHSTVIRMTKLPTKDDEAKKFLESNNARLSINYDECPDLVRFHCQGLTQYGDDIHHLVLYDNPIRTFGHFIDTDHEGTEISTIDCFRLIRGALSAFAYLETNHYILTEFDENNFYVGSFAEDRRALFKVLFKGYYELSHPSHIFFPTKHRFSPPEVGSNNVYKSYCYTVGLMVLYAILTTNKKEESEECIQQNKNIANIKTRINLAVDLLFGKTKKQKSFKLLQVLFSKKDKDKNQMKNSFKELLEDLLEPNLEKRKSAKEMLRSKFLSEYDIIDYQEYVKEYEGDELSNEMAEKK